MNPFEHKELGEVADITKLAGFEFTKHIKYIDDGEIIALRALNLRHGELDLSDVKRIDKSVSELLPRSKLYVNDILLTYTGNGYGDCAIVEENDKYHLAPNICKIEPNSEKVVPYFLYSYIRTKQFYKVMSSHMTGSGQPTIPMKTIRLLPVPIPPMEIQEKIARIAYCINEKIRKNNTINKNLLEQAIALFEQQFVTSNNQAEQLPLYEFADYINGAAFKPKELGDVGLPVIKIAELKAGITDSTRYFSGNKGDKYLVKDKDILFSWSGNPDTSIDTFIWTHGDAILNQHTFNVKSKFDCPWFTFLLLKYHKPVFSHIASNKQTTGLGHVTAADLKRLSFSFDLSQICDFEQMIFPTMELYYQNILENQQLTELRDVLLPKLISGELDVSALDI